MNKIVDNRLTAKEKQKFIIKLPLSLTSKVDDYGIELILNFKGIPFTSVLIDKYDLQKVLGDRN